MNEKTFWILERTHAGDTLQSALEAELKKADEHIVELSARWYAIFRKIYSSEIENLLNSVGESWKTGKPEPPMIPSIFTEGEIPDPSSNEKLCRASRLSKNFHTMALELLSEADELLLDTRAKEWGLYSNSREENEAQDLMMDAAKRMGLSEKILDRVNNPSASELIEINKRRLINLLSEGILTFS